MKPKEARRFSDLYLKAIEFFQKYQNELEHIRQILDIRLNQLSHAYTTENRLPAEAVVIKTRVKTFESFMKKLETTGMTDFSFPGKIIHDLIGARVVCWFLDDCRGITNCITSSNFVNVQKDKVFNYIDKPKPSGYRGIHLHAMIAYERMSAANCQVKLSPEKLLCEIQVRTKLMDAWADLTHEFHYKSKLLGIVDQHLERVLEAQAKRFFSEDESFVAMRNLYQKMVTGGVQQRDGV